MTGKELIQKEERINKQVIANLKKYAQKRADRASKYLAAKQPIKAEKALLAQQSASEALIMCEKDGYNTALVEFEVNRKDWLEMVNYNLDVGEIAVAASHERRIKANYEVLQFMYSIVAMVQAASKAKA